jgi:hypothetical protein
VEDAKQSSESLKGGRRAWLLAGGMWLGPLAWAIDLAFSYSLVQHSCSTGHYYVLHLISALCACVALAGVAVAVRQYRELPPGSNDEGGSAFDRGHFMALFGIVNSIGFFVVVIAGAVPRWMLTPCR